MTNCCYEGALNNLNICSYGDRIFLLPYKIEVVSTNWRDDYYNKFRDYEEMGIPEYWIADYAALGARKFIGNPKQPTIFVCELVDDEYQMTPFQGNSVISSPSFPQYCLVSAKKIENCRLGWVLQPNLQFSTKPSVLSHY